MSEGRGGREAGKVAVPIEALPCAGPSGRRIPRSSSASGSCKSLPSEPAYSTAPASLCAERREHSAAAAGTSAWPVSSGDLAEGVG